MPFTALKHDYWLVACDSQDLLLDVVRRLMPFTALKLVNSDVQPQSRNASCAPPNAVYGIETIDASNCILNPLWLCAA